MPSSNHPRVAGIAGGVTRDDTAVDNTMPHSAPIFSAEFYTTNLCGPAPDPKPSKPPSPSRNSYKGPPSISTSADLVLSASNYSQFSDRLKFITKGCIERYGIRHPETTEISGEAMELIIRVARRILGVLERIESHREKLEEAEGTNNAPFYSKISGFPEYVGDISNYFDRMAAFERSGAAGWDFEKRRLAMVLTLPMKIVRRVIEETNGREPKDERSFFSTVKQVGEDIERAEWLMDNSLNPPNPWRAQVKKYEEEKRRGRRLPTVCGNGRKAFKFVPQREERKYKKLGRKCFRCGGMSHRWFQCVNEWSKDGTDIIKGYRGSNS
ncbi:hypothetical protein FPQ18DRAFT_171277 [Pyronema domesticum]|nr:hypothetical protein FPQ18DRAFT_171277 [Pyronema domesticum]